MTFVVVGSAASIHAFIFGGPPDQDEHVKHWRWSLYTRGVIETEQQTRARLDRARRMRQAVLA